MSGIMKVTSAGPGGTLINMAEVISQKAFDQLFAKALKIGTGESRLSGASSITSIEIGDCITVFAVEKIDGKIGCIIGWHIDDGSTIDGIREEFDKWAESDLEHDFFIIGGNQEATQGEGCLLENIHVAISGYFTGDFKIVHELVDLNPDGLFKYVSANLQMNGTFSYCYHN